MTGSCMKTFLNSAITYNTVWHNIITTKPFYYCFYSFHQGIFLVNVLCVESEIDTVVENLPQFECENKAIHRIFVNACIHNSILTMAFKKRPGESLDR